ncbi:MAG: hypothetical protein OHK0021_16870 [Bryobacter sp.]
MNISEISRLEASDSRIEAPAKASAPTNERSEVVAAIRSALREGGLSAVAKPQELINNELQIAFDRESRQYVVRVLDRQTQEVVRQIPAEDVLSRARFFVETSERAAEQQVAGQQLAG